jgi:hypothetical protein
MTGRSKSYILANGDFVNKLDETIFQVVITGTKLPEGLNMAGILDKPGDSACLHQLQAQDVEERRMAEYKY